MNAYDTIGNARARKGLHYQRPRVVWTGKHPLLEALMELIAERDFIPKSPKRARPDRSRHQGCPK
jgi:hypothetical protein